MTAISFGVTYPAGQLAATPLNEYTTQVEEVGFNAIWLVDNLGSGTPGLECLTTMGYMAACSKRLTVGTSVLLLPLHNPVLLAHAISSLDRVCGGRLILGVGVGDVESHEPIGSDRRTRGARCDEALQLMKQLWTQNKTDFEGRFYSVHNYTLAPRQLQTPHVPVWIGGFSQAALARAGRHATGFICIGSSPSTCGQVFDAVDAHAHAAGRPALTRAVHVYFALASSTDAAAEVASIALSERTGSTVMLSSAEPHVLGTPETCRDVLRGFVRAGVTHFIFDPVCRPDEVTGQLATLQAEVLQPLRQT